MHTKTTTTILRSLRALMRDTKTVKRHLDAYIVPSGDSHQVGFFKSFERTSRTTLVAVLLLLLVLVKVLVSNR